MLFEKHPCPPLPPAASADNQALADWNALFDRHNEVACLGNVRYSVTERPHKMDPTDNIREQTRSFISKEELSCGVRFQHNPGEAHWTAVKNILKYLRNTKTAFFGVWWYPGRTAELNVFVMLDSRPDRVIRNLANLAKYIAASEAAKEAVWIRKFIDELGVVPSNDYPIKMNCDNSAAIIIAKESGI
ncbi:hypothetical protein Tco_1379124 [Tanacetum coccineum]